MHKPFGENPLIFTQVIIHKWKMDMSWADSSVKIWQNLPINNPKPDLYNINAHSSVKIWQNLPINNPKPDLYNINAHSKFGENPLMLTKLSSGHKNILFPDGICHLDLFLPISSLNWRKLGREGEVGGGYDYIALDRAFLT